MTNLIENFRALVEANKSVKHLRSLVLNLGLTGRLGTSDPREQRPQLSLTGDSGASALAPHANWIVCHLPDVAEIEMGNSPPGTSYNEHGEGVPLINGPVEFSPGPFGLTRRTKFTTAPARMCRRGDLLVCVRGATTGRTNIADFDACIGRGVALVRARTNQEYLNYYMWSVGTDLLAAGTGTTFPAISRDDLVALVVLVPPLGEQKRIVAKIDQLMALCDDLEVCQAKKRETSTRLTKSALQALTVAEGPEEFDVAWKRVVDNFDVLIDRSDKVAELRKAIVELATAGRLRVPGYPRPAVWHTVTLGSLTLSMDSGWSPKCEEVPTAGEHEWGVLKTTAVQAGRFLAEHHKALPAKLSPRPEMAVEPGDLLVTRAGPTARVGVACAVESVRPRLMLSDKIVRIRVDQTLVSPIFAALALNGAHSQTFLKSAQSGMDLAQVNISQSRFRETPILVPPIDYQKRAVVSVARLMKVCDDLEARLTRAEERASQLVGAVVRDLVA